MRTLFVFCIFSFVFNLPFHAYSRHLFISPRVTFMVDERASIFLVHPVAAVGYALEMTMGMGFPMGMGIPWEWELVTKLGMGMGRNGNRWHGNGREWECKKPFPGICTCDVMSR